MVKKNEKNKPNITPGIAELNSSICNLIIRRTIKTIKKAIDSPQKMNGFDVLTKG